MYFSSIVLLCLVSLIHAVSDKTGYTGTFEEGGEGGLSGSVFVQDARSLLIKDYQLLDAAAPALYWWGASTDDLSSGFRISEEQVIETSAGGELQIKLDSGKTTADFSTVGLWCERFGVNFGQATLEPAGRNGTAASGTSGSTSARKPKKISPFRLILRDQYTTARAYFFSVLGLLLLESLYHLPLYLTCLIKREGTCTQSLGRHTKFYLFIHKLFTLPSPFPSITTKTLPDMLRLAMFIALNILWGWNRNEFTSDFDLYGWLTLANGGLALLFAARTNVFAIVARVPSTTLLLYHRWTGRVTVIHATIHVIFLIRSYIKSGQLATVLQTLRIQLGLMAWISLVLIAITSFSLIRRRWFEVFYYPHALFLLFVAGALVHATHAPEFLIPGLALWFIDRLIRFVYNFRHVEVESVSQHPGDLTKINVRGFTSRTPGQIAWVQISGVSFLNWHPFTIASAPSPAKEATFAVRGLGNYTRGVHAFATKVGEARTSKAAASGCTPELKVRIDGPYGVGPTVWGYHPVTVIVAGGIGITPGISIASHIIGQARNLGAHAAPQNRHIHILWVVKVAQHTSWFEDKLADLMAIASDPSVPATMDLRIHITGEKATELGANESAYGAHAAQRFQPSSSLQQVSHHGRPDLQAFFHSIRARHPGLDATVSACGPRPLIDATRREAVAGQTEGRNKGAYHVVEEVFEF
ncbi:MAG: hypothetical protein M1833_004674 [Piccolia ochrophora]|nr:MAG: hypothetical protein M1833_004674 [Piccolia ochrophora]